MAAPEQHSAQQSSFSVHASLLASSTDRFIEPNEVNDHQETREKGHISVSCSTLKKLTLLKMDKPDFPSCSFDEKLSPFRFGTMFCAACCMLSKLSLRCYQGLFAVVNSEHIACSGAEEEKVNANA